MTKFKKNWSIILAAAIVLFTIVGKITQQPATMEPMIKMGLENHLNLLIALETIALILYAIPRTLNLGFFLINAYYGGAIAVNLKTPDQAIPAVVILLFIWILTFIHKPQLFIHKIDDTSQQMQ